MTEIFHVRTRRWSVDAATDKIEAIVTKDGGFQMIYSFNVGKAEDTKAACQARIETMKSDYRKWSGVEQDFDLEVDI